MALGNEVDQDQGLAVLTEASAALRNAGLETPVVLDTITSLLVEHVADTAIVYLLADNGIDIEVGALTSRSSAVMPAVVERESTVQYRIDGPAPIERCVREAKPLRFPVVDLTTLVSLPDSYRRMLEADPMRSIVYLPLMTGTEALGVLVVTRGLQEHGPISDAEFELACDLAWIAARALASAKLHREVARSTALFETAFHAAPIGMALVSTTADPGRLMQVNAALTEATGYSESELLGMRVPQLFPPEARPQIEGDLRSAAAGRPEESQSRHVRGHLICRDGTAVSAQIDACGVAVPGRPSRIGLLQVQVLAT